MKVGKKCKMLSTILPFLSFSSYFNLFQAITDLQILLYADFTHKYKIIQGITNDICPGNICPGDICPYQQYLSCYWPDLDQTLNKGFWEQIQQITTVPMTFVQATFVLGTFVHISNISAVTGPIWIKL